MPERKYTRWLAAIFLLTLAVRLILAFTTPNFTYDSYFHLRQIEHISETGLPLYNDPLSYGGRQHIFLPVFHYVFAAFSFFMPVEIAAKAFSALLFSTLTILAYLIAARITQNKPASLFSALIAGFLPVLFTPNRLSIDALFFPLVFLNIYAFLRLPERKYLYTYLGSFILLCFVSSATALLIIGYGVYVLLSFMEGAALPKAEKELFIFSLFFFGWSQFLFFKNVLASYGIAFIWRNVPPQIVSDYFPSLSIPAAIVLVSLVPFLAGTYMVYRSLFYLHDRKLLFLISLVISTTILTWLRLAEFLFSLALFGVVLAIFFAPFYQQSLDYLRKTRFTFLKNNYAILIGVILIFSTVWPALNAALGQETPTPEEVAAFRWISRELPEDATVLALLEEGHLLTYYGQRKNMMDDQFALVRDVPVRFAGLQALYTTVFQTQAFELMTKYGLDYVMITPRAKQQYMLAGLKYYSPECFERVYGAETRIYRVKCALQEVS